MPPTVRPEISTPLSAAVWNSGRTSVDTPAVAPQPIENMAALDRPAMVTERWLVSTPLGREVVPEE